MGKWMLCMLAGALVSGAVAEDWYTWRGPTADGISAETGLNPESAKVIWTKELGAGYSAVCVKNGRLFTMGNKEDTDYLYCLDEKTGDEIWNYSYACTAGKFKGPRATPVIDGAFLYTVSRDGVAFCFDAKSGTKKWETDVLKATANKNVRWGISSSAVIEGDLILLNIGDRGTALDKNTGKVVWKSKGVQSYASVVVFDFKDKRAAAIFSTPGLQVVDTQTGELIDSYEWKTKYDINGADPLVFDEKLFISSGYGRGCALLDFSSGKLKKLWENETLKNQFSSSVYLDGFIYGVDGQTKKKGMLRCLDAKDGSEKWSMKLGFGSLIAADGKLIALGEKGTLHFAEAVPGAYNEISKLETGLTQLCWTPPVLANGVVYCRNDKGKLVAVKVK